MKNTHEIARREFLYLMGITASALVLKACSSPAETVNETAVPTATEPPATLTPEPPAAPTPEPAQPELSPILPEMVLVEAGEFLMGSEDGYPDEQPVHAVTISKPFNIGKYEVTFEEYDLYCDDTGRFDKPDDRGLGRGKQPVIGVDWEDVVDYCNWLSEKEGLTPCYSGKGKVTKCDFSANGYRLPTEAEWEYAARGGNQGQGFIFAGSDDPDEVAWYAGNSDGIIHKGGEKKANELGLFDMSGNMYEWCWDWYVEAYYAESPAVDPPGPPLPKVDNPWDLVRVRRSGSWREDAQAVRCTMRSFDGPDYPGDNGFRLVRAG